MRTAKFALPLLLAALLLSGCGAKPTLDAKVDVNGRSAEIQMIVANFQMQKDGHGHLYLDGDNDPNHVVMIDKLRYTFRNMKPGHHSVRVELTKPDHNPIGVETTVAFDIQ